MSDDVPLDELKRQGALEKKCADLLAELSKESLWVYALYRLPHEECVSAHWDGLGSLDDHRRLIGSVKRSLEYLEKYLEWRKRARVGTPPSPL
jgi:hypothetical protein